jgi:hypothetical protein
MLRIESGQNRLQASINDGGDGSTYIIGGTFLTQDGRWHLATFTFDGSTEKLYLDGAIDGTHSFSATIHQSGKTLYIGSTPAPISGNCFQGNLDDPRIYNRALSASEVAGLFYNGAR